MQPLVIIGSGLAAYTLAKAWRQLDQTTPLVIISQSAGDYYSKPMLSTALTKHKSASDLSLQSAEAMAQQLNATILTEATVTAIDKHAKRISIGDQCQSYSRLVLAVGAEPIALALQGEAAGDTISINHLEDYARFEKWLIGKDSIAILGSGLVGCELMNDLLNSGRRVTIASLDASPLARFLPMELGAAFERVLAERGVDWHLAVSATAISSQDNMFRVSLSNGKSVQADGVISAVGLRASTLLADQADLAVGQAIEVDRYLQTSDEHIFALGDCASIDGEVLQYVAPLLLSARALAKTLIGERTAVAFPPMPVIIKTPACPVVAIPPERDMAGQWEVSVAESDGTARFVDSDGVLRGFALIGADVSQRAALLKELQAVRS